LLSNQAKYLSLVHHYNIHVYVDLILRRQL